MRPIEKGKFGLIFYSISFAVHFTLIFILGVLSSLWGEINEIFYVLIQKNWNYSLILFFTTLGSWIYSGFLILLKKKSSWTSKFSQLPNFFQILIKLLLPLLSFIFDTFILLLTFVAGAGHLKLVLYLLCFLLPILLIIGLITLGIIIPPVISFLRNFLLKSRNNSTLKKKSHLHRRILSVFVPILIVLLYIGVLFLPLVTHPSSIYTETIPEKPMIIAHRGAAHISPENTIEAVQCASEIGADGWEVDVRISIDGVFFLMHDTTLKRTTDVASVFPERIDEDASSFTMLELLQLDAGSWFVDRDPFGTIRSGRVDAEAADSYLGAKIPLLDEILNYTVDNPHWIDIDMKEPSTDHPYASQYEDLLLEKLNLSNLTEKVIIQSYKPAAGNFTHLLSPGEYSIEEMIGIGAELIDEKYWLPNDKIGEYNEANLPIMVGVLNSRIRFSQVWSLGVQMVLTDDPDVFIKMTVPLRIMNNSTFIPLWIGLSLISYGGGFSFYIYKEKQKKAQTELK